MVEYTYEVMIIQYKTTKILLTGHIQPEVQTIIEYWCKCANNLWNSVIFRVRQSHFENCDYEQFFDENDILRTWRKDKKVKINYGQLCQDLKSDENYQLLGGQQGQQLIKVICETFKSYNKLLPMWFKGQLTGKPKLPNYRRKAGLCPFKFTKQVLKIDSRLNLCRLPLNKKSKSDYVWGDILIPCPHNLTQDNLVEVKILPKLGKLWAEYVIKESQTLAEGLDYTQGLGIDPGVNNWLTCVSTQGKSFILDGHKVKSVNARYNKLVAKYKQGKSDFYWDEKLDKIAHYRDCFMRDAVNKAARFIINYCLNNCIGNIVFGWGQGVKNKSNLGTKNNQNFVQIPTARLKERIKQLAESVGINFVETEESYTSIASFLDDDFLPTYGEKPQEWKPSGKRVKRGLYKSSNGHLINADANGASNILRKVTTQLNLDLIKVDKEALALPKRYRLDYLSKSYRQRVETQQQLSFVTSM